MTILRNGICTNQNMTFFVRGAETIINSYEPQYTKNIKMTNQNPIGTQITDLSVMIDGCSLWA